jgi:hypothetical protein
MTAIRILECCWPNGNTNTTMTDRRKKPAVRVDVLLHLVFFGLIGAVTIILFSVAAVSLLGIGREPPTDSRTGHSVLSYTGANAASVPPETSLVKVLPAFPQQGTPTSETSGPSGAEPAHERPSPDGDASTTTPETADAAGVSAIETRSTEVIGSENAAAGPLLAADANVIPDASRSVPTVMVPGEERDQVPPDVEIRQSQPSKLDPSLGSDDKTAAQLFQNPRVHGHLLSPNAAFRRRVQKECGPIIFPALRRHCIASFGIHYR